MVKVNTLFGICFSAMCCLLTPLEFCNATNQSVTPVNQESAIDDACKNLAKVLDFCFIEKYGHDEAETSMCESNMRRILGSDSAVQKAKRLFDWLYGEKRDGMKALLTAMQRRIGLVRITHDVAYTILNLLIKELNNDENWELPGDLLPNIGIWIFERNKFLIDNNLEIPASIKEFQKKLMNIQVDNEEERAFTNSMIGLLSKVLGEAWLDEAQTENGLKEGKWREGLDIIRTFCSQRSLSCESRIGTKMSNLLAKFKATTEY